MKTLIEIIRKMQMGKPTVCFPVEKQKSYNAFIIVRL